MSPAVLLGIGAVGMALLALVSLAMGAGALGLSHVNDAGYWMFAKLVGLEVGSALRTWTTLTTVMGVTGFALTAAVWPFV